MRILATKGGNEVVIVGFLYKGANNDNLKAIFVKEDGTIEDSDVANFTVTMSVPTDANFVDAVRNMKVKSW